MASGVICLWRMVWGNVNVGMRVQDQGCSEAVWYNMADGLITHLIFNWLKPFSYSSDIHWCNSTLGHDWSLRNFVLRHSQAGGLWNNTLEHRKEIEDSRLSLKWIEQRNPSRWRNLIQPDSGETLNPVRDQVEDWVSVLQLWWNLRLVHAKRSNYRSPFTLTPGKGVSFGLRVLFLVCHDSVILRPG